MTSQRTRRGMPGLLSAWLLLTLAAGTFAVSAQQPGTSRLRLVSTAWPPFTNESGQPRFALDLVEAALSRIGITSTTTIVDAAQFNASLLSGRFDGSAAAWKDPQRERVLLYSQPYLENRLILLGRAGADVSATSFAQLTGKRIAIVQGYAYGDAVEQSGPTFLRSGTEEESLRMLLDGRVDYALMDELVVKYIASQHAEQARTRLAVATTPILTRPLYLAVRRDLPDAAAIVERFNAQLRGMIADRTYHRLLHVDWIQADVDGDGIAEYVPQSDRARPLEPSLSYTLFSTDKPLAAPIVPNPRVLIGGSVYDGWTSVPDRFKVTDPDKPDPNRSTLGIFRFVW
jgi:polar amino acid transport system substrate-binding protein